MTFDEIVAASGLPAAELEPILRQVTVIGLTQIHVTAPPYTLTPGDRPVAGRLIRAQLADSDWAISLRHLRVTAGSTATRYLLVLCDGSRDRAELRRLLSEAFKTEVTQQQIDDGIDELAHQYCFEA
jgi:hypothetical protein